MAEPMAARKSGAGRLPVIAGDIGGTSARLLLVAPDGMVLSELTGPGANVRSSGTAALDTLAETLRELLERADAHTGPGVAAAVLGMSGAGPARAERIRAEIAARTEPLGIPPERLSITDDLLTAFLSGEVGDDGLLLLAGTGAVQVRYEGREQVRRRDGMGWMLGDIGSGVWLGRRALEAVAADLDDRGPRTALTEEVGAMLGLDLRQGQEPPSPTGDLRQDLIRGLDEIVPAGSPSQLGRFGRLPGRVPQDPVADGILTEAVRNVLAAARALDPSGTLPVVLAGSVLTADGPIRERVERALDEERRRVRTVPDGLRGAVVLAQELAGRRAAGPRTGSD